jgi:microcystin-dependent protein
VGTGNDGTYTRTISAGNSGGKYQHILDETEMPSHSHLPSGNPDFPFYVTWNAEGVISRQEAGKDKNPSFSFPNTRPLAQEMGSSGEDQPHENTPPAFGLFVWQRVA